MSTVTRKKIVIKKKQPKIITLKPNQVDHAARIQSILEKNKFWIDGSETGTGKTYVTGYIAQQNNFELFIICPVVAFSGWEAISSEYKIPIRFMSSYEGFRSTRGKQPKHGYLTRNDYTEEQEYKRT